MGECECCCTGVDWRSAREVELEARVALLKHKNRIYKKQIKQMQACLAGTKRALSEASNRSRFWQGEYERVDEKNRKLLRISGLSVIRSPLLTRAEIDETLKECDEILSTGLAEVDCDDKKASFSVIRDGEVHKVAEVEMKKPFAQFFVNQGKTFRSHDYGLEYTNYHDFPVKVTVEKL